MNAGEWYVFDGAVQHGPMSRADAAKFFKTNRNTGQISVWRPGLEKWQPADHLFDVAASVRRLIEAPPEASRKRRYSVYGLAIAAALLLSDFLFEWRGPKFRRWSGNDVVENVGYIVGTTLIIVFVCFLIGAMGDGWKNRSHRKGALEPSTFGEPEVQQIVPLDPSRRQNFIAKFWRGEYSLGVSYWLFGLAGNVAVAALAAFIVSVFQTERGYDPLASLVYLASIWALSISFVVLQVTGVWRPANRLIAFRHSVGRKARWATVAKVFVVLGFLSSVSTFLNTGLPQLVETSRMVFMDDPDMGAYFIRVMRNGTEAEISGGFKYGLTDDFSKILKASRQIKVVHLDSNGGRVGEAIRLYDVLKAQGVDTYVSSRCYSACTIAFAAGRGRFLRVGAYLGFHAPSFPGMTRSDMASAVLDQKRIFISSGFDKSFVDKALSIPNNDLWRPSADILQQAAVITGLSYGDDFAISGFGSIADKARMAELLSSALPLFQKLKEKFPKDYEAIITNYYGSYLDGKTESEATLNARATFVTLMSTLRPLSDDDVLADMGLLYADQYQALGAKSAELCYQYASGVGAKSSYSNDMPKALVDRELELNRRTIETAKKRPEIASAVSGDIFKKLEVQLVAQGIGKEQIDLLSADKVSAAEYGDYCLVSTMFFREIGRMPRRDAAIAMRSILSER